MASTRWVLAKYVPNVERNEPVNVGVFVIHGDHVVSRFIGERADHVIDGRSTKHVRSVPTYRAWVDHWRGIATQGPDDLLDLIASMSTTSRESYHLEFGGEYVMGGPETNQDANEALEELYTRLVDDALDRSGNIDRVAERVVGAVQRRIGVTIEREAAVVVRSADDVFDELRFDYRYQNGRTHLMQRVSLAYPDQRSWDRVHAVAWQFVQVQRSEDAALADADLIALVRPRDGGGQALERQLRQLEEHANVVDLGQPDDAEDQLVELIGTS